MFNPNRLSVARKRRQFTKKSLAEAAGITSLTLTRLERGETAYPEAETVASIAKVLNYPVDFFFGEDLDSVDEQTVSFRSLSTLTAKQREASIAASDLALIFNDWVCQHFELPIADLPAMRGEDPITAAASIRSHWGIGSKPISAIVKLFESKGVRIFSLEEQNKNVNAFSFWKNGVPFIFLNTFKSPEASRFDAAHELGHLILHVEGTNKNKDHEREADKFASAFLMPPGDVVSFVPKSPSIRKLIELKKRWGVSVAALSRASFDIGLSSEWHYRDLCRELSMAGYRTSEPESIAREYSSLWKMIFEHLWKDGITKDHVANFLKLPQDEIFSLLKGVDGSCAENRMQTPIGRPTLKVVQ